MKAQTVLVSIAMLIAASTSLAKEGFYSVTRDADGIWWGVRPDGTMFVPNGVVHVCLDPGNPNATTIKTAYGRHCLGKYGTQEAWATNILTRLRQWGFNIIDCASDYDRLFKGGFAEAMGFGYAYGLYTERPLQRGARRKDPNFCITPQDGRHCGLYFPNVFHPDYERITDEYCATICGKRKDDHALFGYYIANELAWQGRSSDVTSAEGMFDYVNGQLDLSHPARQALERIVAECGGDREALSTKEKFLEAVAERYFSVNAAAIRRHDPNHLILGCRFAGPNSPVVTRIAGKYCDVISINAYGWADIAHNEMRAGRFGRPFEPLMREVYDLARKPLFFSEWSFVSLDRGHKSSRGAGMRVRTQRERASAAELYLRTSLSQPFVLGTSWFRFTDKARVSASGGEDCAYGLVDERDEPYPELTAMFRRVHAEEKSLRHAPTPKANPDADDGSMDAATFRAKNRWGKGKLKFTQNGNAYRLENEKGLFFSGRIGKGSLGIAGIDGTNVINFVAMARISKRGADHSEWPNADEVEGFTWDEAAQALYLTVCNRKTAGLGAAYRMKVKMTMNAGGNGLMGEIIEMENIGDKRFELVLAYLRPYPCWKATKEGAHCAATPVYGSSAEATWDQPGEYRVCRCSSLSRNVQKIAFIFFDDGPHPDAIFVPNGGNVVFEPGRKHVFPESMYLVLEPGLKRQSGSPSTEVVTADSFTMLNIVPPSAGREEVAAADAIEFAERTGNPYCLYCLTLNPQGKPASKTVDAGVASYRKWAKLLEGSAVRPAILLQAIVGHWTSDLAEKDREPWQRAINIEGAVTRYCPLDPDYQAYIRDTARKLAECRPAVILSDDDVRAFSPLAECTCPLHTAEYNRRTGLSLTSEELRALIAKADWRSREHKAFAELQRDTVTTVCRLVREGIDSVDPSIPSGVCEPGWPWSQRYIPETARAMAGTNHTAFARLANGQYFEFAAKDGVGFITMRTMAGAERLRNSGLLLLDEADTWPHNAWSKSAAAFHAKLAVGAFIGLKGAKLWYVNAHKGRYPVNRHYTDVLERHRGFYPAISAVARGTSPGGVLIPCSREFPAFSVASSERYGGFNLAGWAQNVFSWYGIPYRATEEFDRDGIYAISGEDFLSWLGDDDIRAMLSRRAVIEGGAARALLKRGFGELMGVELVEGEPLFTGDYSEVRDDFMPFPKSTKPVLFKALPGAKTLSSFIWRESNISREFDRVAASGVVFTNRLGGTVVTTSFTPGLSGSYRCSEARQMYVNDLLDAAGGRPFENSCMNAQNVQTLVRRAPDGTEYLLVENLNYDHDNAVHVRRSARPATVEMMSDHGQWTPVHFTWDEGVLHIPCDLPCYEVKVFRFTPCMQVSASLAVTASAEGGKSFSSLSWNVSQANVTGVAGTQRRVCVKHVDGDATAAIQGEIDRAFAAGGGTVVVGKGEWRVKALRLRSRVTLHLESGATILGSRNPEDYFILDADTVEPVPREWITHEAWTHEQSCSVDNFTRFPASRWNNGLIRLLGAEDAAIIGEPGSVIDGCNPFDPIGEEFYRGPQGISAINCKRLVLKGYTIRQTGNWAHRIADTADLLVENVTCEAGHDGVHVNGCDNVKILKCVMKTGDDCVAGFDNSNVLVEDCYLNTACSGFRFAGTDVTIRRCTLKGPAEYGFRGSLSKEDKVAGAPSGKAKRYNMLSFFTYYSDSTHPVRRNAGRIEIVDCTSDDTDRLLHYNYGNENWQRGKPMTDISFRNVRATRIKMPISLWGDRDVPVRLVFKDCEIGFATPQKEFIRGAYISAVDLDNVKVSGVEQGPLVRLWHADTLRPAVRVEKCIGIGKDVTPADKPWNVKGI